VSSTLAAALGWLVERLPAWVRAAIQTCAFLGQMGVWRQPRYWFTVVPRVFRIARAEHLADTSS
jgi:hypothetical protein